MKHVGELFRELKRRRVFRVALIYLGVGWPVIEASTVLVERLRLPAWTSNLVIVLVIVGFPIALVLAWAFEVTPEGVRRDPVHDGGGDAAPRSGRRSPPRTAPGPDAPSSASASDAADDRETYDGRTVRFSSPTSNAGTVQLIPGRLEIIEGEDQGEVIRFEAPPDAPPEFTFGRRSGDDRTHIQLKARTVSRDHAVMRWEDDRWEIENRSTTNPVRVDGEKLAEEGSATLSDGDRIEMGKVAFRFRED